MVKALLLFFQKNNELPKVIWSAVNLFKVSRRFEAGSLILDQIHHTRECGEIEIADFRPGSNLQCCSYQGSFWNMQFCFYFSNPAGGFGHESIRGCGPRNPYRIR